MAEPQRDAETSELLAALRDEVEHALSPHEREVLIALALNEVPIEVLAERLNTTRGALYKTLHDARRNLRVGMIARGPGYRGEGHMIKRNDVEQLLGRLVGPTGPELGCDECFEVLDRYVELELAGADPEAAIPGMGAHLEGCAACAEDHDSLRTFLLGAR